MFYILIKLKFKKKVIILKFIKEIYIFLELNIFVNLYLIVNIKKKELYNI